MNLLRRQPVLFGLPLGGLLLVLWTPNDAGLVLCPFRLITGHACPGCGITRAVSHLFKGNWALAVGYHPLAPVVVLWLAGAWLYLLGLSQGWWRRLPRSFLITTSVLLAVSFLGVWAFRWATGSLPPV